MTCYDLYKYAQIGCAKVIDEAEKIRRRSLRSGDFETAAEVLDGRRMLDDDLDVICELLAYTNDESGTISDLTKMLKD